MKKITVSNSNRKIVEYGKIETPNKHIHDRLLSWLSTDTSIDCVCVWGGGRVSHSVSLTFYVPIYTCTYVSLHTE
jgi:hypothetical protein